METNLNSKPWKRQQVVIPLCFPRSADNVHIIKERKMWRTTIRMFCRDMTLQKGNLPYSDEPHLSSDLSSPIIFKWCSKVKSNKLLWALWLRVFYYHFPAQQSKFISLIGMFGCHIFCISKLKSWFINFYKSKSYCSVTNNVVPKYGWLIPRFTLKHMPK